MLTKLHINKKSLLLFIGDMLIISIAGSMALSAAPAGHDYSLYLRPATLTLAAFLCVYYFFFYIMDLYSLELRFKNVRYLFRHLTGALLAAGLIAIVFLFVPSLRAGRATLLASTLVIGAGAYAWRLFFDWVFNGKIIRQKKLLIVGAGRAAKMLHDSVKDNGDYEVTGFMVDDDPEKRRFAQHPPIMGGSASLRQMIADNKVDIIVLAITNFRMPELLKSTLECKMDGVAIYDMPAFYEKVTGKVPVEHVTDFWLVFAPLMGVRPNVYNQKIKRVLDIILSIIGLVLTLPISLAAALAIRLESRGPVLYEQTRVGLNGQTFSLKKFRSMKNGTDGDREFAGDPDDPRITKTGRIIRRSRIDEIPQMWNVLKGEMSFIGPRALILDEVREFGTKVPYFSLRHAVRPGITGWAQVNYKHGAKVEDALEKLQYDLFYIKNLSPALDFHILLKTVKVVLSGKGAR